MTLSGSGGEPNRMKIGLVFLVLGLLLLGWAWGSWAFRATRTPAATTLSLTPADDLPDSTPEEKRAVAATSLSLVLLTIMVLFLVVLTGSFVVVRFGRRYFSMIGRRAAAPTASQSVWEMHKAPHHDVEGDDFDVDRRED